MLIIVITLFIIFYPMFNKKDNSGNKVFNEDPKTEGNTTNGNTNTDDDKNNFVFKFNTNEIDMTTNQTLTFGKEIINTNANINYESVVFEISFDGEKLDDGLTQSANKANYYFAPTQIGEYILTASYEKNTSELNINVDADSNSQPIYKLGDQIDLANLHNNETLTRADGGLSLVGNKYLCEKAGILNYYTTSNTSLYALENKHSILVLPEISLCDGEPFFVDSNFHASKTVTISKASVFDFKIALNILLNEEDFNVPEPENLTYELHDNVTFEEFKHPDLSFRLNDTSINSTTIKFTINFYGVNLIIDVQINFV